jgi:hypothetical protein
VLTRVADAGAHLQLPDGLQALNSDAAGGNSGAVEGSAGAQPLRRVERLFSLLAAIHPAYFGARRASAAALAQCALAVEAGLLGLLRGDADVTGDISGAQQGAPARQAALALQAAHRFLAQLARAGGAPVLATLTADDAAALDWLFGVAGAALAADRHAACPDIAGAGASGAGTEQGCQDPEERKDSALSAVSMLYTCRSIACSVAAHGLAAGAAEPDQASSQSAANAAALALPVGLLQGTLAQFDSMQSISGHGRDATKVVAAAQLCAVAGALASAASAACSEHRSKAASGIVAGST